MVTCAPSVSVLQRATFTPTVVACVCAPSASVFHRVTFTPTVTGQEGKQKTTANNRTHTDGKIHVYTEMHVGHVPDVVLRLSCTGAGGGGRLLVACACAPAVSQCSIGRHLLRLHVVVCSPSVSRCSIGRHFSSPVVAWAPAVSDS